MHKSQRARLLLVIVATLACFIFVTWLNVSIYLSSRSLWLFSEQVEPGKLNSVILSELPLSHLNVTASGGDDDNERTKRLPKAIIIGARKSGTRALLKFLELNPAVRPAHSEVHFFDSKQNFINGFDWYRNQMPETKADEIAIEKSPAYFVTNKVPERVRSMNSSIRLILIMRNPVTRLVSDFSQLIANRLEHEPSGGLEWNGLSNKTVEEEVWSDAEREFEAYVLRSDGGIDEQRRAVRTGMYSNYLEKWLAHFPKNQFHFVDGEQLITSPYEVMPKLEKFLGLEARIRPHQFVFDSRKGFYCILANASETPSIDGSQKISSIGQQQLRTDSSQHICLSKSKGRRHVNVSEKLLDRLYEFYAPYNEYLNMLTGINFNRKQ